MKGGASNGDRGALTRGLLGSRRLVRDRLQAALPRLHEQLKQAREREYVAAWREDYAAVKAQRDAIAQTLRERYPAIVDELVTLMTNIAATDKEVDRINVAAPCGDHPRLRGVELTARGLDRLMQPEVSIPQELRLPTLHRDNGPVLAWPPRVPSLAETYVVPPAFLVPVDVEHYRCKVRLTRTLTRSPCPRVRAVSAELGGRAR